MIGRFAPLAVVALAISWFVLDLKGPSTPPETLQIYEFGKIPVVEGGRVKPMDTVARTHLRIVSNRETFKDASGKRHPAMTWLLDVETEFADREQRARKHQVFRIDHPSLRDALGLEQRDTYRYSIEEFGGKLDALAEPLKKAHERKDNKQPIDAYENQLLEFERHLGYYERLARFTTPHVIPPRDGKTWVTLGEAVPKGEQVNLAPEVSAWKEMLLAYGSKDAAKFNPAVKSYLEKMGAAMPKETRKAALEARFNQFDPFTKCMAIYVVGFLLACASWIGWRGPLNWSAWGLIVVAWILHTIALGIRIYLSGRPPVTNLYSSAVFIGWGAVLIGIVLAIVLMRVLKSNVVMSLGSIVAGVAGYATLHIAHTLAADGDTMEVLQAVLDTQFWLATHVTSITFGYTATYVAGLLGVLYIVMGVFTTELSPKIGSVLSRVTYGIICFATFFSFVGTVLGGLWADDSWGRFWGWDPKENGALMIVLWNAIVLHARWGGLARERGIAMLAVFGNIVVSWSWFGVNQLGVGLHSYGFTSGITVALVLFAITQMAIIGFGFFPRELWRSKLPLKGASTEAKIEADA